MYRIDEYMGVYRRGSGNYSSLSPLDMQRKIVQYHIAILSYLSNEVHKKIFLQKTLDTLIGFENTVSSAMQTPENIADHTSWKHLIKALFYKLK
jgi:hypothetical protein